MASTAVYLFNRALSLIQVVVCTLWVRNVEADHAEHTEHIKAEHGGHLPEIPNYEYMNRRGTSLIVPSKFTNVFISL